MTTAAIPASPVAGLEHLLKNLQQDSFGYFVHEVNRKNGLVLDKTAENWPASIAAVGMALTIYTIGVERGMMTRADAVERTLTTLRFFAESEQSEAPDATGYKGFYYHFLDMQTGKRAWDCELSSIDTALLMGGVRMSGSYFDARTDDEHEIRVLADMLYRRVDWAWMLARADVLCHGWKPADAKGPGGFLPWHWEGYDEALILYVLALGSPTHPIAPENYVAWTRTYEWKTIYDMEVLYAGPLFIHQLSHLWIDFRGIRDAAMRAHDSDYFENSRRSTLIQQQYAIKNPMGFEKYGEFCWGVTASDGPGQMSKKIRGIERVFFDYIARGAPFGPDDGTLAPWAVAACLPFAPEIVLPTIEHLHKLRLREVNPYGFKASFSPTYACDCPEDLKEHDAGWVSQYHFGINEGPTVIMVDNHAHDFPWRLMRACPYMQAGLRQAGFTGGWLDAV